MSTQSQISSKARSFPPLARPDARTLILGSMPGLASLQASRYYAHPRNAFWPIMGALYAAGPSLDYAERVEKLLHARIAVWDVLESCIRPGSLDSSIQVADSQVNDFPGFLAAHPGIDRIFFNGRTAMHLFQKRVRPFLPGCVAGEQCLPSTSPAYATLSLDDKIRQWSVLRLVGA